ncbi:MAG: hypothetical protein ACRCUY_05245 [Thermoguttaceae bacterium]
MKKIFCAVVAASLVLLSASFAKADVVLNGQVWFGNNAGFKYDDTSGAINVSPWQMTDESTGNLFTAFCIAPNVNFVGGTTYQTANLMDVNFLSATQMTMITQLVGYTYSSAFDGNKLLNKNLASSLQATLWEIVSERDLPTSATEVYTAVNNPIGNGSFSLLAPLSQTVQTGANNMLEALYNDVIGNNQLANLRTWDRLGYDWNDYDINVYYTGEDRSISQTLISVSAKGQGGAATPEPATLLICGLGACVGFPLMRRRFVKA